MAGLLVRLSLLCLAVSALVLPCATGCGSALHGTVPSGASNEEARKPPVLMPPPQRMAVGAARVAFRSIPRVVTSLEPTAVENYACEVLWSDFRRCFGVAPSFVTAADAEKGSGSCNIFIGTLKGNPALAKLGGDDLADAVNRVGRPSEGYVIRSAGSPDQPVLLVAGVDDVGVLYGVQTLVQLVRLHDNRLEIPWPVTIDDWPTLATRGVLAVIREPEELDRLARWRLNAIVCTQFEDLARGPTQGERPESFERLREECHRRGIRVFGGVSQRNIEAWVQRHPERFGALSFRVDDRRATALVERILTRFASAGADGLFLMLDGPLDAGFSPAELGREHGKWTQLARTVSAPRGIGRVHVMPAQPRLDYDPDYYRTFRATIDASGAGEPGVRTLFCPFRDEQVREAQEAGLAGYEWWHNGVWPLGGGDWSPPGYEDLLGGFYRVEWGWYGAVDADADLLKALRTIASRTPAVWGNVRSYDGMWGSYCWDPRRYAPDRYEVSLAEVNLGPGAGEPYWYVITHLRTWARNARDRRGDAARFLASERRARAALETLRGRVDPPEPHPGRMPVAERRSEVWELSRDVDRIRERTLRPVFDAPADIFVGHCNVAIESAVRGAEVRYTTDGSPPTPKSRRAGRSVRLWGTATVLANAFVDDSPVLSTPVSATFREVQPHAAVLPPSPLIGLWRDYYEGDWTGGTAFEGLKPVASAPIADFSIAGGRRDQGVAFVFHGFFKATHTGVYRFRVQADDACRLWLAGDRRLETAPALSGEPKTAECAVALAKGFHPFRVEYWNTSDDKHLLIEYCDSEMPAFLPIPPALLARHGQMP